MTLLSAYLYNTCRLAVNIVQSMMEISAPTCWKGSFTTGYFIVWLNSNKFCHLTIKRSRNYLKEVIGNHLGNNQDLHVIGLYMYLEEI